MAKMNLNPHVQFIKQLDLGRLFWGNYGGETTSASQQGWQEE